MQKPIKFFSFVFAGLMLFLITSCSKKDDVSAGKVSKTVKLATAGPLSTSLSAIEKSTVTNLTITGTIDDRDFKIMRDSMPVLAVLDISKVTILAYTGTQGTGQGTMSTTYPANEIPQYAFANAIISTTLTSINIPSSVTSIGDGAFEECKGLTSIYIPTSVTTIGDASFAGCTGLISITIPSSVTSISFGAFEECTGLTSITIPSSVTSIYDRAFEDCKGLTKIFENSIIPPNLMYSEDVFREINTSTCILYVPVGSKSAYQTTTGWDWFYNIVEM